MCIPILVTTHVETVCLLNRKKHSEKVENEKVVGRAHLETGLEKTVLEEIRTLAQKYKIDKVILFGSRARGDCKRVSDIDMAVSGGDISGFAVAIDEETSTLLEYDIVNLDGSVQEEIRTVIGKEKYCMKKYDNFCSALSNLEDIYHYDEPYDNVVLTGLVALYEICFEQAWKGNERNIRVSWFFGKRDRFSKAGIKNCL